MIPEHDRKRIQQAVLAAIEPSQPDLADRVMAATRAGGERQRDARSPWLLSAAAVLLAGALVAALVFGTRLAVRPPRQATGPSPVPSSSQGGSGLGLPTDRSMWVRFTSRNTGWAAQSVVAPQLGQKQRTTVYATSDGGDHWIARLTYEGFLPGQLILNPDGEGIIVAAADVGGEAGTPIYFRTRDGGVHWQQMPNPAPAESWGSVYFKNPREGWAAAYRRGETMVSSMYHTTDGARTWSRSKTFDAHQVFGRTGLPLQVAFRNAGEGVAFGRTYLGTDVPLTPPRLWATRDGGDTWRPVDLAVPAGVKLDSTNVAMFATMLPDGTCVVFVRGYSNPSVSDAQFSYKSPQPSTPVYSFSSTDGGLTFGPAIRLPDDATEYAHLLDARHWWVQGGGSSLMATADGGLTWKTYAQVLPDGLTWNTYGQVPLGGLHRGSIRFVNPMDGWALAFRPEAAGQTYLFQTHDGGAHWSAITPPNPIPR